MKIFDRKAFTLVEIIAAIAIMGILMGVVIASFGSSLRKSHDNHCQQQVDMMIVAGRDYFNDKKTELPLDIGSEKCINLGYLQNNSYIEAIKDYSGGLCNTTNSKVCAMKITGSNYYYTGYLDCGKCSSDNVKEENESAPTIEFKPNNGDVLNKDIVVEMSFPRVQPISYSYTVFQTDENDSTGSRGVPIKKIDFREYKNKNPKIVLNKKGYFYIEGYAYSSNGKKGYKKSGIYHLDYNLDCEKSVKISAKYRNGILEKETWVNGAIDINVDATGAVNNYNVIVNRDGKGEKTVLNNVTGSNTLNYDDRQTGKYTVKVVAYDILGNSCETKPVVYYQDNVKPTCETKVFYDDNGTKNYNGEWSNKKLYFKPLCTDNESGCNNNKNRGKVINIDYNGMASAGEVYDMAGNSNNCSDVATKLDVTKPTCTIKLSKIDGKNGYYKTDVKANLTASDNNGGSGIVKYSFDTDKDSILNVVNTDNQLKQSATYKEDTNGEEYYATIVDAAGNVGKCESGEFKLDKTPPKCNFNVSGESTNFRNIGDIDDLIVNLKCSDKGSGCSKNDYGNLLNKDVKDDLKGKTVEKKEFSKSISDKAGNTTKCKKTVNVYVDNEKPICGEWNGNNKWTNQDVTVSIKCSDKGSGCKNKTYTKTYEGTDKESEKRVDKVVLKICDKVGNCRSCNTASDIKENRGICDDKNCEGNKLKIYRDITPPVAKIEECEVDVNGNIKKCDIDGIRNVEKKFFFSYNDKLSGMKCVGDAKCKNGNYFYTKVVSNGEEFDKYGRHEGETCYTEGWEPEDGRAPCADQGFFGKYWRAYYAEDKASNKSKVICYYIEDNVPNSKINGVTSQNGKTCSVNGYTFTRP